MKEMMVFMSQWESVRHRFTQEERDALNSARGGKVHICARPRSASGWVVLVDVSKLSPELAVKLERECGRGCQADGCTDHHVALCDEPIADGGTCDRRLCKKHRVRVGKNLDRCPAHAEGRR